MATGERRRGVLAEMSKSGPKCNARSLTGLLRWALSRFSF